LKHWNRSQLKLPMMLAAIWNSLRLITLTDVPTSLIAGGVRPMFLVTIIRGGS